MSFKMVCPKCGYVGDIFEFIDELFYSVLKSYVADRSVVKSIGYWEIDNTLSVDIDWKKLEEYEKDAEIYNEEVWWKCPKCKTVILKPTIIIEEKTIKPKYVVFG